jgi:hypothetical protein
MERQLLPEEDIETWFRLGQRIGPNTRRSAVEDKFPGKKKSAVYPCLKFRQ